MNTEITPDEVSEPIVTDRPQETPRRANWAALLPLLLIAGAVVVLDRLSKIWIQDTLGNPSGSQIIELIPGWLRLHYIQNTGAAFGIFKSGGWVLAILSAL